MREQLEKIVKEHEEKCSHLIGGSEYKELVTELRSLLDSNSECNKQQLAMVKIIDTYLSLHRETSKLRCVYPDKRYANKCDLECKDCINTFYEYCRKKIIIQCRIRRN